MTPAKIVATMLSGNNESQVADAIRSVIDWVDLFLLIDTGINDKTVEIVQREAGTKFLCDRFPWCGDFAKARNFALERAAAHGGQWALTVDTDERLSFSGLNSPAELNSLLQNNPEVLVWLVPYEGGSYSKERLMRVPTHLSWQGRTHEALIGATAPQRGILAGVTFGELPKNADQTASKLNRDLEILRAETLQLPHEPRWWYYLGQTLEDLKKHSEAVDAYRRCATLDGWAEQAAWACYKGASCLSQIDDYQEAIQLCAFGLGKQPSFPELAWLAGFCCYQLGEYSNAICWEQMAVTLGHFKGIQSGRDRTSFRHLPGWYEGPFDVLRFAYRSLGLHKQADEAEQDMQNALRLRVTQA